MRQNQNKIFQNSVNKKPLIYEIYENSMMTLD